MPQLLLQSHSVVIVVAAGGEEVLEFQVAGKLRRLQIVCLII